MTTPPIRYSPELDPHIEAEVRAMLIEHYGSVYKDRVESFIDTSLATEHFAGRFLYLKSVVGSDVFTPESTILISGFGMGSEMIMARQFGFGKVYGVEVEQILADVGEKRLHQFQDMYPTLYDGNILPYEDGQFNVVTSGHVIEHTRDPSSYLREVLRVLVPGGYISLEFPHRYNRVELHTQLPSFEWLPRSWRNFTLRMLSSKGSPLKEDIKSRYNSIVATNLQQISVGGVRRMLKKVVYPSTMINFVEVEGAPGVIRSVIRRD
jgi:ubiquinone/menaquinone biosynthesis C-methylase UbiE